MNSLTRWVFFSLFAATLPSCGAKQVADEPVVPSLKVFTVGEQASGQARRISGRLKATNKSPLSFGVAGRVLERLVERGQKVVVGEVVARLDPEPLKLSLQNARSKVTAARAVVREAETVFKRVGSLLASQGSSQSEVDEAERRLASATGDLDQAKGSLQQAEIDFSRTELKAPFDGQIAETSVDRFQEVGASETVAVIQANGVLEVDLTVPETLIQHVDYGQTVAATIPSLEGVALIGTVTLIGAESEAGAGFPVTVRLAKSDAALRPGMTASVTFNFRDYLDGRTAFLVPLSAVAIDAGIAASGGKAPASDGRRDDVPMFVLDSDQQIVSLRKVVVGDLRGNKLEVFEGLAAGDLVVTAGVAFVRDGMKAKAWTGAQGGLR